MVTPLVVTVYVLGALTVASFIVFVVLLIRYLRQTPTLTAEQASVAAARDQLQALDTAKLFDSVGKTIDATTSLARALNRARPVAIAALLTILFLISWLFSLTLLILS